MVSANKVDSASAREYPANYSRVDHIVRAGYPRPYGCKGEVKSWLLPSPTYPSPNLSSCYSDATDELPTLERHGHW